MCLTIGLVQQTEQYTIIWKAVKNNKKAKGVALLSGHYNPTLVFCFHFRPLGGTPFIPAHRLIVYLGQPPSPVSGCQALPHTANKFPITWSESPFPLRNNTSHSPYHHNGFTWWKNSYEIPNRKSFQPLYCTHYLIHLPDNLRRHLQQHSKAWFEQKLGWKCTCLGPNHISVPPAGATQLKLTGLPS